MKKPTISKLRQCRIHKVSYPWLEYKKLFPCCFVTIPLVEIEFGKKGSGKKLAKVLGYKL